MPPSIREMRGVSTFEYNGKSLFVKAGVAAVSTALSELRGGSEPQTCLSSKPVTLTKQCFFVFRLDGHLWTQIIARDPISTGGNPFLGGTFDPAELQADLVTHIREDDAKELSKTLNTSALYYSVADTSYGLSYTLFEQGKLLERLESGDEVDEEGELTSVCNWQASDGTPGPENADAGMKWVEELFERLDAFEPGLRFERMIASMNHSPGDECRVSTEAEEIESIQFIALKP